MTTHSALLAPWRQPPTGTPHAGPAEPLEPGSIRAPVDPAAVPVTAGHDGREVGRLVSCEHRPAGMAGVLRLDEHGRQLLAAGWTGVSVETDDDGRLAVIALTRRGDQAYASARVLDAAAAEPGPVVAPSVGPDAVAASRAPTTGPNDQTPPAWNPEPWGKQSGVILGTGAKAPTTTEQRGPAPGPVRAFALGEDPEREVERARRRFEEQRAALSAADGEREWREHVARCREQAQQLYAGWQERCRQRATAGRRRQRAERQRARQVADDRALGALGHWTGR